MFILLELRLYQHAQDHRFLIRDILHYSSLYGYILLVLCLVSGILPNSCGNNAAANLAPYPWLTPDIKYYPVLRCTVEVQRGVTRPAAAVRQPGAEMNEMYGMSTSEGLSQTNLVWNFYPGLSWDSDMQVWISYPNYPGLFQSKNS